MAIAAHGKAAIGKIMDGPEHHWAPLMPGGSVIYKTIDDGATHRLDCWRVQSGLDAFPRASPRQYGEFIRENEDADTGDVFLQLCLFGEVVFG